MLAASTYHVPGVPTLVPKTDLSKGSSCSKIDKVKLFRGKEQTRVRA